MAKRELIGTEQLKEVFKKYHVMYRQNAINYLIDKCEPVTEEEIVKPYLEKLSSEICEAYEEYDGYDPHSLGLFEERVQDLIDNLKPDEVDDVCEWIKYDYRTVCPKNHDIDNPYWRIPESNMDALKYCPYCGKKIKVKGEEE